MITIQSIRERFDLKLKESDEVVTAFALRDVVVIVTRFGEVLELRWDHSY